VGESTSMGWLCDEFKQCSTVSGRRTICFGQVIETELQDAGPKRELGPWYPNAKFEARMQN
jgi:hypothetical protein